MKKTWKKQISQITITPERLEQWERHNGSFRLKGPPQPKPRLLSRATICPISSMARESIVSIQMMVAISIRQILNETLISMIFSFAVLPKESNLFWFGLSLRIYIYSRRVRSIFGFALNDDISEKWQLTDCNDYRELFFIAFVARIDRIDICPTIISFMVRVCLWLFNSINEMIFYAFHTLDILYCIRISIVDWVLAVNNTWKRANKVIGFLCAYYCCSVSEGMNHYFCGIVPPLE